MEEKKEMEKANNLKEIIPEIGIRRKKTILNGLEQYEYVDRNIIRKLENGGKLREEVYEEDDKKKYYNEKEYMEAYKFEIEKGRKKVVYKINKIGYGRVYPENGLSMGVFRKEIRHTILKDKYVDIDIVNCHPVILEQIMRKNNIKSPNLTRYVKEREKIIRETKEIYGIEEREKIKELYIRLMYGGKYESWAKENKIKKKETKYIEELIEEMEEIGEIIVKNNRELEERVKEIKKEHEREYKISNTVSYYLQEYERRILEEIYKYLVNKKVIIKDGILCYDGIMILKERYKKEILKDIEEEIKNKLGFDIKLEEKEMSKDYLKEIKEIEIIDKESVKYFDRKYINELKSYDEVREYFEYFVCKIDFPPNYIFFEKGKKEEGLEKFQSIMNQGELEKIFNDIKYYGYNKDGEIVENKFITRWIDDKEKRVYKKMDFLPRNEVNIKQNGMIYNLFGGWDEKVLTKYDISKKEKYMKPFEDLGLELCGGEKKYFDYLMNYFAHMIQYPDVRIPISFIIKGKQGTGKNVFLNAIGNIMDPNNYITSSNPNDFFGEYAEGFYHKILINMNECEGRDTFVFEGKLKSFISEARIRMNPKFMRPVDINNYSRLIIFSNKSTPIPIDVKSKDRRYVVYQTTDKYLDKKYSATYWKRLIEHFNKPEFIAVLYDELNNRDIREWNFIKERPITEAYIEMCKNFIPIEALYFEDFIRTKKYVEIDNENKNKEDTYKKEIRIKGSKLYDDYLEWCRRYNFIKEMVPNIRSFNLKLKELEFPIITVTYEGTIRLKIIPENINKILKDKKWLLNDDFIEEKTVIEDESFISKTFDV